MQEVNMMNDICFTPAGNERSLRIQFRVYLNIGVTNESTLHSFSLQVQRNYREGRIAFRLVYTRWIVSWVMVLASPPMRIIFTGVQLYEDVQPGFCLGSFLF